MSGPRFKPGSWDMSNRSWLWVYGLVFVLCCTGCWVKEPLVYRALFPKKTSSLSRALNWIRIAPLSVPSSHFTRSHQRARSAFTHANKKRVIHPKRSTRETRPLCVGCSAVVSYRFKYKTHPLYTYLGRFGRSFVYDNSLLLIVLSNRRRCREGQRIVRTLQRLQNSNGSWGFSFDTWGNDYYNRGYIRAGSVAWAGYGLSLFASRCRSWSALSSAVRAYRYLESLRVRKRRDRRYGLYKAGTGRWSPDRKKLYVGHKMQTCATEHQVDIYFFYKRLAKSVRRRRLRYQIRQRAERLAWRIMRVLWIPQEGRFAMGVHADALNTEWALDAAGAWGALFLHARGQKERALRSLRSVERRFLTRRSGIYGYRPYAGRIQDAPHVRWEQVHTLFIEGSIGVALAYLRLGKRKRALWLLHQFQQTMDVGGGLPYALGARKDFPEVASAASTLWFILFSLEVRTGRALLWSE